jgi:hypothetical protein
MRREPTAEQDPAVGVTPAAPWRVIAVTPLPGYRLHVRFVDGTEGGVELASMVMHERAGGFSALRDPELFAQVGLQLGAVTWPGELDLAPDAMYDAVKKCGTWAPVP